MTDTTQPAPEAAPETKTTTAPVEQPTSTETPAAEAPKPAETPQAEDNTEEAAAPEQESPGDDPADEAQPKKKGGGFQNRIDKLTREKYEADLRAQTAERKLAELGRNQPGSIDAEPGPEPKLEEFTTVDDFTRAHTDWARREGYRYAKHEVQARQAQEAENAAFAALNVREDEARRKYADYDQSVGTIAPIVLSVPVLKEYFMQSETGPEVGYHLAKNPGLLLDLQKMHPVNAVRELTKLEAKLSAPPPPKPVTSAPAPIKPVGESEKAPFTLEKAEMDEFVKRRNEEMRKARKG